MKKEEVITFIIIILVVSLELFTQNHTKKTVDDVNAKLGEIKDATISGDYDMDDMQKRSDEIYNLWEKESETLSCYLEHDELEKVDLKLRIIKASFESKSEINDEVIPEIEEGMYSLEHIRDKQRLNLKNIL